MRYLRTMDIPLAVNGTLMRGLELNANLTAAGAHFVREAATALSRDTRGRGKARAAPARGSHRRNGAHFGAAARHRTLLLE